MKKLIIVFCFSILQVGLLFAQTVKIGNTKISVKKGDTLISITQINDISSSEGQPKSNHYFKSSGYIGVGFMLPEHSNDYFRIWGGNTYHLDIGCLHRYQVSRHFSLGATMQYSFYNYRLKDALSSLAFVEEVIGHPVNEQDIYKQVYRSNNIGAGVFTRFYIIPTPTRSNDQGVYIDCGVQGDFSYSKFFKTKSNSDGNEKYRDGYAFNPLNASAYVRLGWNSVAIVAHYRLTNVFNKDVLPMDLPPLSIGIQFL